MEHGKQRKINQSAAYGAVVEAFRRQPRGMTVADLVAKTALPVETVRSLVNDAADEYSARLSVTESGEILYSFPHGFTSRYRGWRAVLRRTGGKLARALKAVAAGLFKGWIMVMLVGYFALFMLIALAALALSMAGSSSSSSNRRSNSGGGLYLGSSIFNFVIRIWFYSELTRSLGGGYGYGSGRAAPQRPKGKPLYRAIFGFVFGDGDPNADLATREKRAVIAYIQANSGVISVPELSALTGRTGAEADSLISAYCSEFAGMPEATEDGTVVYRFDALLRQAEAPPRASLEAPPRLLSRFSSNPARANVWFCVINAANLLFGGYFLANALSTGAIPLPLHPAAPFDLYRLTYALLDSLGANPLPALAIGLGIVPAAFSVLFWLVPGVRCLLLRRDNERAKLENLRKAAFRHIWERPEGVRPADIEASADARPRNLAAARERVIRDAGVYSTPEIAVDASGEAVYTFPELARERAALARYRASIRPEASGLGKVVFTS